MSFPALPRASVGYEDGLVDSLRSLTVLHGTGAPSDEEFAAAKLRLLGTP